MLKKQSKIIRRLTIVFLMSFFLLVTAFVDDDYAKPSGLRDTSRDVSSSTSSSGICLPNNEWQWKLDNWNQCDWNNYYKWKKNN